MPIGDPNTFHTDSSTSSTATTGPRRTRLAGGTVGALLGGILGAAIAAGAALGGAGIAAYASRETSNAQVQAEREKEDRDRISAVYNGYLDAAVKYKIASNNVVRAHGIQGAIDGLNALGSGIATEHTSSAVGGALSLDEHTLALERTRDETAAAFELAINNLAVHGSAAAWGIHKELVPVLKNPNSGTSVEIELVKEDRFNELLSKFRAVFCEGVSLEKTTCAARAAS